MKTGCLLTRKLCFKKNVFGLGQFQARSALQQTAGVHALTLYSACRLLPEGRRLVFSHPLCTDRYQQPHDGTQLGTSWWLLPPASPRIFLNRSASICKFPRVNCLPSPWHSSLEKVSKGYLVILSAKKLFWLFQNYRFHHTFLNSSCKVEKKKKRWVCTFCSLKYYRIKFITVNWNLVQATLGRVLDWLATRDDFSPSKYLGASYLQNNEW